MTKRIKISLLALFLCVAMCFLLCACSGGDTTTKIKRYISSEQKQFDAVNAALGDTLKMRALARGNSLVCSYQYKVDLSIDDAEMAETLNSGLDTMASTFISVLRELQQTVPEAESVIVEYLDKAGNVITSREFKLETE